MNASNPARAFAGQGGTGATGRLGLVLALIVSILGAVALHAGTAQAADPTAPAKAPLISGMPLLLTTDTTAEFVFGNGNGETQAVTGFICRVDSEEFTPCTSPLSLSGLAVGDHFIGIKAKNDIGTGPEATFAWTVDPAPTETTNLGPLKVTPKTKQVKAGKKTKFTVAVENSGIFDANGTKVCVTGPSKLISVKKCQSVGLLESEQIATLTFEVTVKKNVKKGKELNKGKKAVLTFTASATGAESKTAKATINIK